VVFRLLRDFIERRSMTKVQWGTSPCLILDVRFQHWPSTRDSSTQRHTLKHHRFPPRSSHVVRTYIMPSINCLTVVFTSLRTVTSSKRIILKPCSRWDWRLYQKGQRRSPCSQRVRRLFTIWERRNTIRTSPSEQDHRHCCCLFVTPQTLILEPSSTVPLHVQCLYKPVN
jgi:hypothetical protein